MPGESRRQTSERQCHLFQVRVFDIHTTGKLILTLAS